MTAARNSGQMVILSLGCDSKSDSTRKDAV